MKKYALASGLTETAINILSRQDIEIIGFPDNPSVSETIRNHADISFFYAGDSTVFTVNEMSDTLDRLKKLGFDVQIITERLGKNYPLDVPLNCVVIGNHLICNIKTVSRDILHYFKEKKFKIINVRQGYTKCSVVPVDNKSLITDDESIANECKKYGIDVLKISKGCVKLHGYDYGFIGGASGNFGDFIFFNGTPDKHEDFEAMKDFITKHGKKYIYADGELTDIGSIIPLFQEEHL